MTLREIQDEVDRWTGQFDPQYWPPFQINSRMSEEVGELSREVSHIYGFKKKKPDELESSIGKELSDIVFTVACMANSQNIDLQEEWEKMMKEKHYGRDQNRYEKKGQH